MSLVTVAHHIYDSDMTLLTHTHTVNVIIIPKMLIRLGYISLSLFCVESVCILVLREIVMISELAY